MIGDANTNRLLECSSQSLLREIASYAGRTDVEIIADRFLSNITGVCMTSAAPEAGDIDDGYRAIECPTTAGRDS